MRRLNKFQQIKETFEAQDIWNVLILISCGGIYFYTFLIFLSAYSGHENKSWTVSEFSEFLLPKHKPETLRSHVWQQCQYAAKDPHPTLGGIEPLYKYDSSDVDAIAYPELKKKPPSVNWKYYGRQKRWFDLQVNKKRVLACIPPKTGTSNWQYAFVQYLKTQLEAKQDLTNAFVGNHQLYKVLPRLNLTKFAKEHQLPHTSLTNKIAPFFDYSFSSSRHPLIRLLSAYHSKFSIYNPKIDGPTNIFLYNYHPRIIDRYEQDGYKKLDYYLVSFRALVEFIVEENCKDKKSMLHECDPHWVPFSYYCQPCIQNYSSIAQSEDLRYGSKHIIDDISGGYQLGENFIAPSYSGTRKLNHENHTYVKEMFYDGIPVETKKKLVSLYFWDFKLYGYDYKYILGL